jgi:membrane protein DedA with SNARE-associated domain
METVLTWLLEYKYLAMISILLLCGVGLPIPEEVTLLGSGLLVGWKEADFWLASAVCGLGILAGDSVIFGLGHHFGARFLRARPMSFILSPERDARVQRFFARHGSSALFIARFFPGVRIGVYAYAGAQRVPWSRFFGLDLLGVLISAPTSIWAGRFIAQAFADDREQAIAQAHAKAEGMGHWLLLGAVAVVVLTFGGQFLLRRVFGRP